MSNKSYLCVTDHDGLYPSATLQDYEPGLHTLACDVGCVPLLWLALFRPGDLRTEMFEANPDEGGGTIAATAPVTSKQAALSQLDAAVPVLRQLFGEPIGEHAMLLRQGLEAMTGAFVTIELAEIAMLYNEEDDFDALLRAGLASLETPADPTAGRARLAGLSQLRLGRPLPPARLILDGLDAADDGWWNHCRLLGARFDRPVPWEDTDAPGSA